MSKHMTHFKTRCPICCEEYSKETIRWAEFGKWMEDRGYTKKWLKTLLQSYDKMLKRTVKKEEYQLRTKHMWKN